MIYAYKPIHSCFFVPTPMHAEHILDVFFVHSSQRHRQLNEQKSMIAL